MTSLLLLVVCGSWDGGMQVEAGMLSLYTKSDTIIPAPLLLGFIIFSPFIPHWVGWSSLDMNVDSSWKKTTVFARCSLVGQSTLGRAFAASSVGVAVKCKNPILVNFRRNTLRASTTSGLS